MSLFLYICRQNWKNWKNKHSNEPRKLRLGRNIEMISMPWHLLQLFMPPLSYTVLEDNSCEYGEKQRIGWSKLVYQIMKSNLVNLGYLELFKMSPRNGLRGYQWKGRSLQGSKSVAASHNKFRTLTRRNVIGMIHVLPNIVFFFLNWAEIYILSVYIEENINEIIRLSLVRRCVTYSSNSITGIISFKKI